MSDNDSDAPGPSRRNVTSRSVRRNVRVASVDESDDVVMMREMSKQPRKRAAVGDDAETPEAKHARMMELLEQIKSKKNMFNAANCFDTRSALSMFNIDDCVQIKMKIQDMAIMLESSQQMYSYRVDKLLSEVRAMHEELIGAETKEQQTVPVKNGRGKKKDEVQGTSSNVTSLLAKRTEEDKKNDDKQDDDGTATAEPLPFAEEIDYLLDRAKSQEFSLDVEIEDLAQMRVEKLDGQLKQFGGKERNKENKEKREEVVKNIDQDREVEWFRTNPYYQKAKQGDSDDVTSAFSSFAIHGVYSPDGRMLKLHKNMEDTRLPVPSSVDTDVVASMRLVIVNALKQNPVQFDNYLFLDVPHRPRPSRYKELNQRKRPGYKKNADVTDMTMDADQTMAGPSNNMTFLNDTTIAPGMDLDETRVKPSTANVFERVCKETGTVRDTDEFENIEIEQIMMDNSIEHLLPECDRAFKADYLHYVIQTNIDNAKKDGNLVLIAGMFGDEWVKTEGMVAAIKPMVFSGIDSFVKAVDALANAEVFKMIITKDDYKQLELFAIEQHQTEKKTRFRRVPNPGKYFLIRENQNYKQMYPRDTQIRIELAPETIAEAVVELIPGLDNNDNEFYETCDQDILERAPSGNREDDNNADDDQLNSSSTVNLDMAHHDRLAAIATSVEEMADLEAQSIPDHVLNTDAILKEIQDIGKDDASHWKRREKDEEDARKEAKKNMKPQKKNPRKMGCEEFANYFKEDSTPILVDQMTTSNRCILVNNYNSVLMRKEQIHMRVTPLECKPFIAIDIENLSKGGLMFNQKYENTKVDRIFKEKHHDPQLMTDDNSNGALATDGLEWLLTFNGYQCSYEPDKDPHKSDLSRIEDYSPNDDDYYVASSPVLERDDAPEDEQETCNLIRRNHLTNTQNRLASMVTNNDNVRAALHRRMEEEPYASDSDNDDLFDDDKPFSRSKNRSKTLDAGKHKRCIAGILNSAKLTMPNIQYALDKMVLNVRERSVDQDETNRDETVRSATPIDANETRIGTAFNIKSPEKVDMDVSAIMEEIRDVPDYVDETTTGQKFDIDPSNPPVEKVHVNGVHTFMSMMLCMPHRMQENVQPSSILSFALHLCNENNLVLHQNRNNDNWMTDFLITNSNEGIPSGVAISDDTDMDTTWDVRDPHTRQGPSTSTPIHSGGNTPSRPHATARRRNRADLSIVAEEEELMD